MLAFFCFAIKVELLLTKDQKENSLYRCYKIMCGPVLVEITAHKLEGWLGLLNVFYMLFCYCFFFVFLEFYDQVSYL